MFPWLAYVRSLIKNRDTWHLPSTESLPSGFSINLGRRKDWLSSDAREHGGYDETQGDTRPRRRGRFQRVRRPRGTRGVRPRSAHDNGGAFTGCERLCPCRGERPGLPLSERAPFEVFFYLRSQPAGCYRGRWKKSEVRFNEPELPTNRWQIKGFYRTQVPVLRSPVFPNKQLQIQLPPRAGVWPGPRSNEGRPGLKGNALLPEYRARGALVLPETGRTTRR